MTAEEVIKLLDLKPLPEEGGYFRETYRARERLPKSALPLHNGDRSLATQIFYLVTPDEFSGLHRVKNSDEFFHFYLGDSVEMVQINLSGQLSMHTLGSDISKGQLLQICVEKGVWQGTRLKEGGKWALLGCTVAPGFDFQDFEVKNREDFCKLYPAHRDAIYNYTRE